MKEKNIYILFQSFVYAFVMIDGYPLTRKFQFFNEKWHKTLQQQLKIKWINSHQNRNHHLGHQP